jgi:hypothetical protein
MNTKKKLEERIVQEFPRRCPYCEKIVSYENVQLKNGENEVECPFCQKKYIKVVFDESPPPPYQVRGRLSPSPVTGGGEMLGIYLQKEREIKGR